MESIHDLEQELQLYKSALESLENSNDSNPNDDFEEMKATFSKIIEEKSSELLEAKKLSLLSNLDAIENEIVTNNIKSVIFRCYNGTIIKRNVVIEKCIDDESLFYFKNPLYPNEVKCPHVTSQTCNYSENCKFSHGVFIETSELDDPVDDKVFDIDDNCYVLDDESLLWCLGKILHIDREHDGNCIVEMKKRLNNSTKDPDVISVDIDKVIKEVIADFDEDEEEDDEMSDEDFCEKEPEMLSQESNNSVNLISDKFGSWEKHTKGIGLKLMMQMGYEVGRGLGANSQGRVEPVQVDNGKKGTIVKKRRRKKCNKSSECNKPQLKPGTKEYNKDRVLKNEFRLKHLREDLLRAQRQQELYAMDLVQSNIWLSRIDRIKQKIDMIHLEDKKIVEGTTNTTKIDKKRAF